MRGQITLKPHESKRLIAKGIAATESIQAALKNHSIIIAGGTTNSYIVEELLGIKFDKSADYSVGVITHGKTGLSPEESRVPPFVITNGVARERDFHWKSYLDDIQPGDVFIKGGNAIDHTGLAGVLASNEQGGTIGTAWGTLLQRGIEILVPIGLEKLVPSVRKAVELTARQQTHKALGDRVGLMPMLGARTFTETEALKLLYDLDATCIASGGIAGSEGAITLLIEGDSNKIDQVFELVEGFRK